MEDTRPTLTAPFKGWNDKTMETESSNVLLGLQSSKSFISIADKITDLATKLDAYKAARAAASTRDKNAIKAKNKAKSDLTKSLFTINDSVTELADGNIAILTESSLTIRKARESRQPEKVSGIKLSTGDLEGMLYGKWKDAKGKRMYFAEYTPNPMTEQSAWKRINVAQSSCNIPGLVSGTKVWVRIGVIGTANETIWSDAVLSPYIP